MAQDRRRYGASGGGQAEFLLDGYCEQLGSLIERQHTELALIEAKRQADTAATLAKDAMLRAQAADRAKTSFLANMSHELRTPLNAIIGFSEMIKLSGGLPDTRSAEYIECILDAGRHLLALINDVLDLARVEAGRTELSEDLVSIHEIVHTSIRTVRPLYEKKALLVTYEVSPTGDQISVDPVKLKQVFVNILSNAIKFTQPGGRLMVAARLAQSGDLEITFADTGAGIPREHLHRVLEPFEQLSSHLTRQEEGSGLGLPIARALVRLHGGELMLDSEVGVGTTVTVRLPRERVHPPAAAAA